MTRRSPGGGPIWWRINFLLGLVVFGVLPLLAIPAVIATVVEFGLVSGLVSTVLPVLLVTVPLGAWVWYGTHLPRTRRAQLAWLSLVVLTTMLLLVTPVFFWTIPALTVLFSEGMRALVRPPAKRTERPPVPVRSER
ncbi:hypothetical protein [Cellulosimicrobium cellulans]|uniref:hypothetical protein n=1 Tax=Cellulosimicrobium cellulans TaxID=1710 RepID=UPI000302D0B9|nr:hypothetical protein [Cellulosimicrobium cellulans]